MVPIDVGKQRGFERHEVAPRPHAALRREELVEAGLPGIVLELG